MFAAYGNSDAFDAAVYGLPDMRTVEFLGNQLSQLQTMGVPASFIENTYGMYEQFNGSEAIARASALVNNHNFMLEDTLREIGNIYMAQTANIITQRYMLAHPETRALYLKDRLDGFSDTYINEHGNDIGEEHYDYRKVMSGVLQTVEDDEEISHRFKFYIDDLEEGDRPLSSVEKLDVVNTWDWMSLMLNSDNEFDPTDPTGGRL